MPEGIGYNGHETRKGATKMLTAKRKAAKKKKKKGKKKEGNSFFRGSVGSTGSV